MPTPAPTLTSTKDVLLAKKQKAKELYGFQKEPLAKLIDTTVYVGIVIMALGVIASVINDFCPNYFHWISCATNAVTHKLYPTFNPFAALAQTLWLFGDVVLLIAPIYNLSAIFIVLQTNAGLSCLIPILQLGFWSEFCIRLSMTYAGIGVLIWLRQVPFWCIFKVLLPTYWLETLKGKHGPIQTCVVGTEFVGWGYALMGSNRLAAFSLVLLGSVYLVRFAYLGMKQNIPLSRQWYILNWVYIIGLSLKVTYQLFVHLGFKLI